MPDIYVYFGLTFYFGSNEHLPIHVHIEKAGREIKVCFIIQNGKIVAFEYKRVNGKRPLNAADMKLVEELLNAKKEVIRSRWIDYFINNKRFRTIKITKRIK
jgi:hypothetical protein